MVIMLQRTKNFHHTKALLISVIAMSLAACAGTEVTNTPTDSASSAPSLASSSSPETTTPSSVTIPGVSNVKEINFKAPSGNGINGYFDTVNGATTTTFVEVPKAAPLTTKGWAFLADEGRLPDSVLITYGNDNSLVAVAPINLERSDVAKFLKNPAYKNSGWNVTFNSSALPAGKVVLKAWAYNSARKEATQLNPPHEVTLLE